VIAGLVVYLVLEWAEFSLSVWDPSQESGAMTLIVTGPYRWVFWIVHLALGTALPLVLLGAARDRRLWALAALLVAVTLLSTRLNVLIPGQAVPELRGLEAAFQHPRLTFTYHATLMEYLVGCFFVAVGIAAFFLVRRVGAVIAFRIARGMPVPSSEVES
jgi:molybdopterin-containing oxidoreductase family membrane subunit